jgi:hypothetical protein
MCSIVGSNGQENCSTHGIHLYIAHPNKLAIKGQLSLLYVLADGSRLMAKWFVPYFNNYFSFEKLSELSEK